MTTQNSDPDTKDDLTPGEKPATVASDQQPTSGGEDWETRYKGQQKVMAKKDAQIAKLQEQLDLLAGQIEELRPLVDTRTKEKSELETSKTTLEQQLQEARKEADAMKRKLAHTAIIVQDYSLLAPLSDYIPESEDEAVFRKEAEKLNATVQKLIDGEVKRVLAGASPPQPKGNSGLVTSAEEDELWRKVASLAGRPGKEAEYEAAYKQWIALQETKNR